MDRTVIWAFAGVAALAAISVYFHEVSDNTDRRDLFASAQPVNEELLRAKLQSDGYDTIQILEDQGRLVATALKDGKKSRFVIDSKTGKDDSLFYDDDD